MNIINHPYIEVLDVWEGEKREGAKKKSTRIIKVYDNHLHVHQVWNQMGSTFQRRALADAKSDSLMECTIILL